MDRCTDRCDTPVGILLKTAKTSYNQSKLKQFADDNFKFDKKDGKFSERVENAVRKGEIALLFP